MRTLLVIISLASTFAVGEDTHLFILSGQSNMAGHRPDEAFTPAVTEEFGQENVIVVQHAQGGQPIYRWDEQWQAPEGLEQPVTGDLYQALLARVRKAVGQREITTVTFLWMQGERDAKMGWADRYEGAFTRLLGQIRKDLKIEAGNVVIGRLSDFDLENSRYPEWTAIRDIQVAIAESSPRHEWVDTDDLNDGVNRRGKEISDDLHYSADGYRIFGERLAAKAIALIASN
ncbi:MAG: sialate O-acetylesterase [Verrucomicrobiota bacterium]